MLFRALSLLVVALLGTSVLPAAFAGEPSAPVIVYLSLEDGSAFTGEGRELQLKFFAESFPGHRVALVRTRDRRFFGDRERVRREVLEKMTGLLRPGETVTHLVIATHGATLKRREGTVTKLHALGEISEEGLDQKLLEVLKPLKGRLAADANVVLDSCSTMCGTEDQARRRASAFMSALGATEGVLYGARTPEVDLEKLGPASRSWEKLKPRLSLLGALALLSMSAVAPDPVGTHLRTGAISGVLLAAMVQYMEPLFVFIYERTGLVNQGRLYALKRGRVAASEPVRKTLETLSRLYRAQACGRVLLQ